MTDLPKIYCAIDTDDKAIAIRTVRTLDGLCGIKLGLTFFNKHGNSGVQEVIAESGIKSLFLDLKCHDIPAQVGGAIQSLANLVPDYLTIHASGGTEMMRAAKESTDLKTRLLGVTVLTSLNADMLASVGQGTDTVTQVVRLANLAQESGLDGVVCSSHEIEILRKECGKDFVLMVPGIRPVGASLDDQQRVMTPQQAMAKGASHLVIGRPITGASAPLLAAQAILDSIA